VDRVLVVLSAKGQTGGLSIGSVLVRVETRLDIGHESLLVGGEGSLFPILAVVDVAPLDLTPHRISMHFALFARLPDRQQKLKLGNTFA